MSDIHDLLSKHFLNETSAQEEMEVKKYIASNKHEYEMLKKLWTAKNINVSEFDKTKAWESVVNRSRKPKAISLFSRLTKVAAVAAILIVAAFVTYHYLPNNDNTMMTELVGDGSKAGITLVDGSVIYLNKDAKLSYPETFAKDQRYVTLDGEAYFDIARDEDRPFKIKTLHSEVEVLGTSFNIDTRNEVTEVSVTSGKVKVTSLATNEAAFLIKSQAAIISNQTVETYENDTENFLAWKTGKFVFKEKTIAEVIDLLATYYDNKITLKKTNADCPLSATFDKASLEDILESITLTCNFNLNETNNNYELY